jgi:hypothetical protein
MKLVQRSFTIFHTVNYLSKNTGNTLKGSDGTILVTAHFFLTVTLDILYFEINDS